MQEDATKNTGEEEKAESKVEQMQDVAIEFAEPVSVCGEWFLRSGTSYLKFEQLRNDAECLFSFLSLCRRCGENTRHLSSRWTQTKITRRKKSSYATLVGAFHWFISALSLYRIRN